ncbi:Uu.00g105220.m01.CDS01 [Anthostomella pinea]|uniref:Uu.00g105220.m01.CDS01 n=1 Tax=Anthostomella pinea TaxID=933095 RepID=A0AAI8VEV5_9PEZI|nr:Uu.00g105220.m01.CDS01 [Anthostomella pinea]
MRSNENKAFTTSSASHGPMLHASSSNNHSLFSLGRNGAPSDVADTLADTSSSSFDFLPSVNFDDLQSSLESASTDFKLTQFPSPTGQGAILDDDGPLVDKMAGQQTNVTQNGGATRVAIQPNPTPNTASRPARSGSILRRPSLTGRQVGNGNGTVPASSGVIDAPTAPAAMRNRRQSHYPPVSNSNIGKPPRKSIGPGVIDSDYGTKTAQKRRPSLMSNTTDRNGDVTRPSMDTTGGQADNTRSFASSRANKTRSVQPLPRLSANFSASTSSNASLDPEKSRLSTAFPRSPRGGGGAGGGSKGSTPNSARRMSVMPGSHATGLGARTISPTDAQRMKRMSAHPQSLASVANAPPPPPIDVRPHSRSPSMIPRKTSTPSSSRTTPDINNRKSYSSGLSVGSTTSYNTHRTSTGSITRAFSQGGPSSRLPAPKGLNIHNAPPAEEEEDVPPVPAIPKAYESPKDSQAELSWLDKRKSNYAFETASIHSNSTGTLSNAPSQEPLNTGQPKAGARKNPPRKTQAGPSADIERRSNANASRKNLQPLRLPPLNVGPLSTPTAAKIAALQDQGHDDGKLSPPPSRITAKTPTTPMTASKSTFFSRRADRDQHVSAPRSSSSVHHSRVETPTAGDAESSSESFLDALNKTPSRKPTVSPYLSSSAPKGGDTFGSLMTKSKTTGDVNQTITVNTSVDTRPQRKPTGPRAPKPPKLVNKSPPPISSPEEQEPQTPSSMSNLRRKLSLSWKRSNSKGSNHQPTSSVDKATDRQARQDSMPPPRIPLSAAMNLTSGKASSPSHAAKPSAGYLNSKRRKSSASSLNAVMAQEKSRTTSKKDVGNSSMIETSTQPRSSSIQKILRPRQSVASIKRDDPYTAELDRDDLVAEDEMKKLASRRKETELAARTLDALHKRASPKERVGPHDAIRIAMLNIYERGEIVDYSDIYFCGTQNASKVVGDLNSTSLPNFGYDDDRGDYTIVAGDHLSYRYEIVDVLGKGSFGQVVRCIDHKTGVLVAVKIIRNKKRFHQQALVEVNILQKLREWDPRNKHSMVNFTHSFYFRGHLCISTELLDMNLYEFIKSNSFRGFSLKLIRRFTKQMLSSLNLLKQHKVIHCDLKPENILLRHPMHSEIKVIDFGSSCFETEKVYTYIQSRFYRSPEVILGMTYGLPIDMWSLGCILAELFTGVPIFPGENEQEQLACIMEVFGPPEKHLIEKSTRKKLFFDSMGKPRLTVSSKGRRRRPSSKTLQQTLKCDDEPFLDFLTRCLRWDPDRRMKPEEAVRHEFITGLKASVPIPRTRESSPVKRNNTINTPRPLPEPPAGAKSGSVFRQRESSNASPHKAVAGSRRASGINGPTTTGTGAGIKRISTGNGAVSTSSIGSSLPRVAGRTASGKQDLASAGANVAMSRRA